MGTGAVGRKRATSRPMQFVPFAPKLLRPAVATSLVDQPRLADRLREFGGTEIVISAPAGYGKSTLVAQWADDETRPFGWLEVDDADNDPVVLVVYLALALDALEPIDPADLTVLTASDAPWESALLPRLRHVLATRQRPFVLALDDVHRLREPSCDKVVKTLTAHVPRCRR